MTNKTSDIVRDNVTLGPRDWCDISNEAWREYTYSNGTIIRVNNPLKLNVQKKEGGDRHRLITKDAARPGSDYETGMYIVPGWLVIRWQAHDGGHGVKF